MTSTPDFLAFRLRYDPKPSKTLSVPPTTTYSALRSKICKTLDIPSSKSIVVLSGFPPRKVCLEAEQQIADVLSGGATLIIESVNGSLGVEADIKKVGERENVEGKGSIWKEKVRKKGIVKRGGGRRRKRGWMFSGDGRSLTEEGVIEGKRIQEAVEARIVMDAVGGGSKNGGGIAGRMFRRGLRAAREERETEAVAEARYKAVLDGTYKIEDVEEKEGKMLEGSFRGIVGRKWRTDERVKAVGKDVLREVVREMMKDEEAREKLRMREMARESLVVFWNMVKIYGTDVEDGLRDLCPDFDWNWMNSRKRKLSEKAKQSRKTEKLWEERKKLGLW